MFPGASPMESANFPWKWRRYVRHFVKNNKYFADLFGSWFLFEILYNSPTIKTSKHMVNRGCFQKPLWQRTPIGLGEKREMFFERISQMKESCKVSCVKVLICSLTFTRSAFIWNIAHLILSEIRQKCSKKSICLKPCDREHNLFVGMKEQCKVFCKIIA